MIKALLAAVGLAPAAHVERLSVEAKRADAKLAQSEERLLQARADAENWKRRHGETEEALNGWKQSATQAQKEAERLRGETEKLKADIEKTKGAAARDLARADEWKARADTLTTDLQDARSKLKALRARLADAERDTAASGEHLMAMEVKLDLIEAAIQLLDARTREGAASTDTAPSGV